MDLTRRVQEGPSFQSEVNAKFDQVFAEAEEVFKKKEDLWEGEDAFEEVVCQYLVTAILTLTKEEAVWVLENLAFVHRYLFQFVNRRCVNRRLHDRETIFALIKAGRALSVKLEMYENGVSQSGAQVVADNEHPKGREEVEKIVEGIGKRAVIVEDGGMQEKVA